jgi:prepilin-type N-terminal cleavage/methylation domain-containing protein
MDFRITIHQVNIKGRKSRPDAGSGFTLIELMVVISIVSLLISILIPALSKARKSAQTTACMSNLRQVGTGLGAYDADYQMLPPNTVYDASGNVIDGQLWYRRLFKHLKLPANESKLAQTSMRSWFWCPTAQIFDSGTFPLQHYGYNSKISSSKWNYLSIRCPQPSTYFLVGELNGNRSSVAVGTSTSSMPVYGANEVGNYRLTHQGGKGSGGYLYVDYHVKNISGNINGTYDPEDIKKYWQWW